MPSLNGAKLSTGTSLSKVQFVSETGHLVRLQLYDIVMREY